MQNEASQFFINQVVKGLHKNHHRDFLDKCQAVTEDEVLAALRKYCLPLFDPSESLAFVVTPPSMLASMMEGLNDLGFYEVFELAPEDSQDENEL